MLLPTCKCCGCECCRTKTYSYTDTEPKGKLFDECPTVGQCGGAAGGGVAGSCANAVLEGFILERFCKQSVKGKKITAKLRKNSTIDDFGSVAGIETDQECGRLGRITKDHDITDALVIEEDPDNSGFILAKVPFRAVNANHGGPYGLAGVVICWCCIKEGDPPCECCQEKCEPCCRKKTYSYKDTEPKGKWYDECAKVGSCGGDAGDCGNDVLEGFIVERFCKAILEGLVLHATLRKNSAIDDFGSVAGIETDQNCGSLGIIAADHDITGSIVIEDDPDDAAYVLAKIPFRAVNANHGGPYGLAAVHVCWCCTPKDDPPCDCCKVDPPPPPPKKYDCIDGSCLEVRNGAYDEPTCGGLCDDVGPCCTEYGLSYVARSKCKAWGGTFYEPGEVFDQTCVCDCALAGDYAEQQPDVGGTCTNSSGGNTLYIADARSWFGEVQGVNCQFVDCGPLQPYVEKGASPIVWVESAFASAGESTLTPTGQCCIGQTRVYKDRYSAFVYNCKTKKLEEVVVFGETSSVDGTDEGEQCSAFLGGGPVPSPATPTINVLGRKPTCAAREAPNPLP